jgi:hypothetical protein
MAPPPPQLPPGTDVWKIPAAKPPPGFTSNLVNPATNENIGVVTLSIFIALATIFVGMRLYVRFKVASQSPWWDDRKHSTFTNDYNRPNTNWKSISATRAGQQTLLARVLTQFANTVWQPPQIAYTGITIYSM